MSTRAMADQPIIGMLTFIHLRTMLLQEQERNGLYMSRVVADAANMSMLRLLIIRPPVGGQHQLQWGQLPVAVSITLNPGTHQ